MFVLVTLQPVQDHYIGAIAALASRFVNRSAVLGFEIMNEPNPTASGIIGFEMGRILFDRFYARVIQAVTGVRDGKPTCATTVPLDETCAYPDLGIRDTRHIFFCEPSALRNQFDFSPEVAEPFTTYANIGYRCGALTAIPSAVPLFMLWSLLAVLTSILTVRLLYAGSLSASQLLFPSSFA